jgi:uncharacterized protein (DUF952 family)
MKKMILIIFIVSLNVMAQGKYSDSEIYVICDVPMENFGNYYLDGYFETESLKTEGFIHCARPSQLQYVMNKYFKSDDYMLFITTKEKLGNMLIYEGDDSSNTYPHLYRRFESSDVINLIAVTRDVYGRFILPNQFRKQ